MDRLACINVKSLPLQLLLRRQPAWRGRPVAVIASMQPQAPIVWLSDTAQKAGVQAGMTYATGQQLAGELLAEVVGADEVTAGVERLHRLLARHSHQVMASGDEAGIFWLAAADRAASSQALEAWVRQIRLDLLDEQFDANVVVGFNWFAAYALSKTSRQWLILPSREQEHAAMRQVRLQRLRLTNGLRQTSQALGLTTLADLLALPGERIFSQLGEDGWRLFCQAAGQASAPWQNKAAAPSQPERWASDHAGRPSGDLAFLLKCMLQRLLNQLQAQHLSPLRLGLQLQLADGSRQQHSLAAPYATWQPALWLDLLQQHLLSLNLPSPIIDIHLAADSEPAKAEALHLFTRRQRRNLDAGNRALAKVREEFGRQSVLQASLRASQRPEAQTQWRPHRGLRHPQPRFGKSRRPLVRRIYERARPLATPPLGQAPTSAGQGWRHWREYLLSGAWWRGEAQRDYQVAPTAHGGANWIYFDRLQQRWFEQGRVE